MGWLSEAFELTRGGAGYQPAMDGLRGLAVFLVFLVHYVTFIDPWIPAEGASRRVATIATELGHSGVDLFFVLSGYLIYGALIVKPRPFGQFIRRRLQRIYPAFAAVLALYVVLSLVFPERSKLPDSAWKMLIYLSANAALLPGLFPITPIVTVAWSLSYEAFYYVLVPVTITLFGLRSWHPRVRIALFLILAAIGIAWGMRAGGPVRLVMFTCGMVLFEALRQPQKLWHGLLAAVGTCGVLSVLFGPPASSTAFDAWRVTILFAVCFGLCGVCFASPRGLAARLLSWAPARRLGNMSYSYYLIHGLALQALFLWFARLWSPTGSSDALVFWLWLPMFLCSLVPAVVLYLLIERPFSLQKSAA